jgi:hypothetical protein
MGVRVIEVPMRLVGIDGRTVEMTEYTPWPERCGIWEADERIHCDGATYIYAGCEGEVYVYHEVREAPQPALV